MAMGRSTLIAKNALTNAMRLACKSSAVIDINWTRVELIVDNVNIGKGK